MNTYDEYEDDWDEEDEDWPKIDEEEAYLGFVPASYTPFGDSVSGLVPARYLCPEGEDWAYFGY